MGLLIVVLISSMFGVNGDEYSGFDVAGMWADAADDLSGGGLIASPFAYLLTIAFEQAVSLVILFFLLAVTLLFSVGITPNYIITQIKIRRELRNENVEFDDEYDAKKLEALRQKSKTK
jgi:hypothetical protein